MQLNPQAFRRALSVTVVLALVALAYLVTVDALYVFDDHVDIVGNPTLRYFWPPDAVRFSRRPFTSATFVFSWWMGGGEAWAFRVFNVIVHAITALCLYAIGRRILRSERLNIDEPVAERLAALAAVLWAVHPLNTSAVTYVVHRYESLAGMFYVGAVLAYLRVRERRSIPWLAALLCALGGLSKETLVTLPIVIWILDAVVFSDGFFGALRLRWKAYVALIFALAPMMAVVSTHSMAPSQGVQAGGGGLSRWAYLVSEPAVLSHYLRLVVWPSPLTNDYYDWPVGFQSAGLVTLALLAFTGWGLIRRSLWSVPFAMFFVVLAPTSSLLPLQHELAAERRMYIPLVALALFGVVAVYRLASRLSARAPTVLSLVGGGAVVALLAATLARNQLYLSRVALYASDVAARPNNARARVWLASSWLEDGKIEEAVAEVLAAQTLDPATPGLSIISTRTATAAGRYEEAAWWGHVAIRLHPDENQAVFAAAIAFARVGDAKGAVELLEGHVNRSDVTANLVELLAWNLATEPDVRDGPRAVAIAERAVRMSAANVPPYYQETLAASLAAAARWAEALQWVDQLLAAAERAGKPERVRRLAAQRANYVRRMPWSRADDNALTGQASPASVEGSAKVPNEKALP